MDIILSALPSIVSGLTLAVVAFLARRLAEFARKINAMQGADKNYIKAKIVDRHETAVERGYVKPNELESTMRLFESYKELGGNSYIAAIVDDMASLPIHKDWEGRGSQS